MLCQNFFQYFFLFLKMTTHRLKTQNMVKLEISTNYDTQCYSSSLERNDATDKCIM